MKTKKIWANMAVENLERTTKFYTKLGFKPNNPHHSEELTSFFVGENDFIMHFFVKDKLKSPFKLDRADLKHGNEIMFTLGAESKKEVDDWEKEVETAGGAIISKPEEFGEGYYGFVFADPDGHRFNVFFMGKMK